MSISDDALAIVAVNLALKSEYLQKHQNLCGAFWKFFHDLKASARAEIPIEVRKDAENEALIAEGEARHKEIEEERERARENWMAIRQEIEPLLLEGHKAGLKDHAYNVLSRAYRFGGLNKPPAELSDQELRDIRIGPKSIANIRQVWHSKGEGK